MHKPPPTYTTSEESTKYRTTWNVRALDKPLAALQHHPSRQSLHYPLMSRHFHLQASRCAFDGTYQLKRVPHRRQRMYRVSRAAHGRRDGHARNSHAGAHQHVAHPLHRGRRHGRPTVVTVGGRVMGAASRAAAAPVWAAAVPPAAALPRPVRRRRGGGRHRRRRRHYRRPYRRRTKAALARRQRRGWY